MIRNRSLLGTYLAMMVLTGLLHSQTPQTIAVRAGRMFDSKTAQLLTKQVLIIQGERISEVGPEDQVKIPAGAQVIDLSQATVLPGLIDAHTHVYSSLSNGARVTTSKEAWTLMAIQNAQTTLRAGFTTVRDVGTHGEGYGDVDIRNAINRGNFEGPRMQVSTRGIGSAGTDYMGAPGVTLPEANAMIYTPEQGREAVREQIHYGADWIKVFPTGAYSFNLAGQLYVEPTFTLAELQAIVDEAHRHHHGVAAHAYGGEGLRNSILAGVDSIEHGQGLDDEMATMMVQKGIYFDVTGYRYTMPEIAESDRQNTGGKYSIIPIYEKNFRNALSRGVKITVGSGVDGTAGDPRSSGPLNHGRQAVEFAWLVNHGMTPVAAIQAGTMVDAEMLGWQDQIGSLEKGKYADIVAVSGDPLKDITELQRMKFVMKGGKVVRNDLK